MIALIIPYLLYTCLILGSLFLQAEIFPYLQIFGAKPDLLMLIVVFSAIKTDWKSGLVVGLMAGFWLDLLLGLNFVPNMLMYGAVGTVLGMLAPRVNFHGPYGGFFATLLATIGGGLLSLVFYNMGGAGLPFFRSFVGIIMPMTFYNLLLVLISMPLTFLRRRSNGLKIARIDLFGNGIVLARGNKVLDRTAGEALRESRAERARLKAERLNQKNRSAAERRQARQTKKSQGTRRKRP